MKEGKSPVLVLIDKNRPGQLVCVLGDDIETFVVEWIAARVVAGEPGDRVEGLIRRAVARLRGEPDPDADLDGDPPAAC
jgi:hypothetical protein